MPQDRRQFLASALTAAPLFVPRSAWGANDRLAYGLIGSGGRGRYLQGNFQKLGAECVAIAALDARKDVYLEKPMSHSIEESQRMIQAVRKTDRIVQIGMQRRSAPAVIE